MENDFYTIASFEYSADAQILKGKLISEDIEVFLKDQYTVDTDPLVSHAIGGVKLQVHLNDKEKAIAIYNEFRKYETDANGNSISCPKCKEKRVLIAPPTKKIIYLLFPFFEPKQYECTNCGEIFKK